MLEIPNSKPQLSLTTHPQHFESSLQLDLTQVHAGLTGERNVYKRRGLPEEKGLNMTQPKHLTLLVDVSGSMYRSALLLFIIIIYFHIQFQFYVFAKEELNH